MKKPLKISKRIRYNLLYRVSRREPLMAKRPTTSKKTMGRGEHLRTPKKTRQGSSINTKYGNKGGGPNNSTASKLYKKKRRGQGRR